MGGFLQSEINATNGTVINFNPGDYSFDLNVSSSPTTVRIDIPYGAVEKDGNLSSAGAFEFRRRIITSVEEDLLAWYPMDESFGTKLHDISGRYRHGDYYGITDATVPGSGDVDASSSNGSYPATNAFDDGGNTNESRWLAHGNQLPNVWISYDFGMPTQVYAYTIQSQSWRNAERAPKDWTLQASDDNANWTVIDTVSGESGWARWETRRFDVGSFGSYRYYKLVISDNNGDNTVGIGEIEFITTNLSDGMFGNALDLNGDYVDLPFKIDQGGTNGMSLSAWVYPRQIDGGTDNERMIFGTDDGGWDWSMAIRTGSLTAWTGSTRYQSPLNLYPNKWYHCVAVFDPKLSKTILHLNGGSITSDSLGLDGSSNLIRLGSHFGNRTFDGLIDDVRVWGRPLSVVEVQKLWGNGMGDLGPNARIEMDSISWSDQLSAKLVLNQPVTDFNASEDLEFSGMSLSSISEVDNSNGTIFNLVLNPDSFTPQSLSLTLSENSITDGQGVQNPEITKNIDFRPHRVRESDLLVWWELNSSNQTGGADPSTISGLQVWFDANDTSTLTFDGSNVISEWRDRSGNSRDATLSMGQPKYNSLGGPAGQATVEFRRTGGNDALAIGGTAFFAKDQFYVFRSISSTFDYFGGILGHTSTYPNSRRSNYLFQNRRTYFHRNQYPAAVYRNGVNLSSPYDLHPVDEYMILRLQVNDANTGPHSDYRIGTIAENSNYSSSVNVSEIIAYNSVLSGSDALVVENYLKNKWGVKNILDSSIVLNHGTGTPRHIPAKFGIGIKFDGSSFGKSISAKIPSLPGNAITLSAWVYPESEDFYLFNADGLPSPASISLRKQRPLLSMSGLDQTGLPGTNINEFWAKGSLALNQWSHLALIYDLSSKRVQFFINGLQDSVSSFAGNLPFPLTTGFRLGPTDDYQATSTIGEIDDFRIYGTALSPQEIQKLYGDGLGDFNRKTIKIATSTNFELPKIIDVHFLEDGVPIRLSQIGSDAFELSDITSPGASTSNLVSLGTGHFQFELTPNDNASIQNLTVSIDGNLIKTEDTNESFENGNLTFTYDPQVPLVTSSAHSNWARGSYSSFQLNVENASSVTLSTLPAGIEFNATANLLHGSPESGGEFVVSVTASNPAASAVQNHRIRILDPLVFASKLELSPNFSSLGQVPSDYPGLSMHLDASQLLEKNGTILNEWPDISGNARGLDQVRGAPYVVSASGEVGHKVVRFDGLSQMFSSYDFGGLLTDYTIFAAVRHTGSQDEAVVASVGSEWIFGLGNSMSGYWKLGNTTLTGPSSDNDWHLLTGTLDQSGVVTLRRDGYEIANGVTALGNNAKPKFLALGELKQMTISPNLKWLKCCFSIVLFCRMKFQNWKLIYKPSGWVGRWRIFLYWLGLAPSLIRISIYCLLRIPQMAVIYASTTIIMRNSLLP